jgi:hypothetical protein
MHCRATGYLQNALSQHGTWGKGVRGAGKAPVSATVVLCAALSCWQVSFAAVLVPNLKVCLLVTDKELACAITELSHCAKAG